jgi:cholesterol oxidase
MNTTSTPEHWDVVVVGSGFGGSVAALRLSEKGYKVLVVESGRRFTRRRTPQDLMAFAEVPLGSVAMGMFGIQRLALLNDVLVLSGAGVGGGSLVYGNTLYEPLDEFYADKQWSPHHRTGAMNSPPTTHRPSACWGWWRTRSRPRPTG